MPLYEFTVKTNDRTYNCERLVSGQDLRRQTVKVIGIGSRDDSAFYGDKGNPPSAMQFNARLIAHEIIKQGQ